MDTSSAPHRWRSGAGPGGRRSLAVLAAHVVASVAIGMVALTPFALAQSAPSWVLVGDGDGAYVEAFSYPPTMTQEDTAIFVICDPDAPSGLNVRLWIGSNAAPPEEAEGLVRLGQGEVQRYTWFVGGANGDRATPKFFDDLDRFIADLRSGGTMAIRLLLHQGIPDANQPTFQYDVSGFSEVERQLACGAAAPGAPDPFGAAPADPFASPPAAAAPAPVAPSAPTPPASPRSRAGAPTAPPTAPPVAPPTAATPPTAPLPPLPPPPSQMAPPPSVARAADWYLYPNAQEVAFDVADRTFGFACLDDGDLAAYLLLPDAGVTTDAEGRTTFAFAYEGFAPETDEWVFLDLGEGLYATDSTASYLIAFAIEANDRVRVSHGGMVVVEAPGGDAFYALTQQMPCLVEGE